MTQRKLLLASGNIKKLDELRRLVQPLGIEIVAPADVGGIPDVDEDSDTFEGNARKKATSGAVASGLWTLADDSGLEVDALDGEPGVRSARFASDAGEGSGDESNNELLLWKLGETPDEERGARFRCTLALAKPDGEVVKCFAGQVEGRIGTELRGDGGFGYDPLFTFTEPGHAETGRGFGELSHEEKASISHRGRALHALAQEIDTLMASNPD